MEEVMGLWWCVKARHFRIYLYSNDCVALSEKIINYLPFPFSARYTNSLPPPCRREKPNHSLRSVCPFITVQTINNINGVTKEALYTDFIAVPE